MENNDDNGIIQDERGKISPRTNSALNSPQKLPRLGPMPSQS
jgi:hypothetical protein